MNLELGLDTFGDVTADADGARVRLVGPVLWSRPWLGRAC